MKFQGFQQAINIVTGDKDKSHPKHSEPDLFGGNGSQVLSYCHRGNFTVKFSNPTYLPFSSEVPFNTKVVHLIMCLPRIMLCSNLGSFDLYQTHVSQISSSCSFDDARVTTPGYSVTDIPSSWGTGYLWYIPIAYVLLLLVTYRFWQGCTCVMSTIFTGKW